jgi:hypothetical protein
MGEARGELALPRRELFLWVCVIIVLNQVVAAVNPLPSASPGQVLSDLAAVSFFQIMVWCAIFRLIAFSDRTQVAQMRDILIALALCLPLFLPTTRTIKVLALGAAFLFWMRGRDDPKLRAAGVVLAALTIQEYWGHIVFDLFALPLLHAETAVVGTLVQALRPGTVWQGNVIAAPSGLGIIVYSGCSSFHSLRTATFEDEAAAEAAPGQDYQQQYVYFDQKWRSPDRWAVSMQRMKYSLLAMLGRTDYATSDFVLEVEAPRNCPGGEPRLALRLESN